jgi:hypothetical protein
MIAVRFDSGAFFGHAAINSTRVLHPKSGADEFRGYSLTYIGPFPFHRIDFSIQQPSNRLLAKFTRFTVQPGYIFRHGNSRLTASNVMGSLQLTRAEAPLHKPGRVAAPAGKTCRSSVFALPARLRLRNHSHNLLAGWRERADLRV